MEEKRKFIREGEELLRGDGEIWWGGFCMVSEKKEIGEEKGRKSDGGNSDPNIICISV